MRSRLGVIVALSAVLLCLAGGSLSLAFAQEATELLVTRRVALESGGWRTGGVQRDGEGNYYVLSPTAGVVWIYDKDFGPKGHIAVGGDAEGRGVRDFAVGRGGELAVADWDDGGKIRVFNKEGTVLSEFAVPRPWSVAVFSTGEILVSGHQRDRLVSVFSQDGAPLYGFGGLLPVVTEPDRNAWLNVGQLAVDDQDNIYYAFSFAPEATIHKFSRDGRLLAQFRPEGERLRQAAVEARARLEEKQGFGGLVLISDIALDPENGDLWVGSVHLYQLSPEGATEAVYQLKVGSGRSVNANHILVAEEQLVVTSRLHGVWTVPKPD